MKIENLFTYCFLDNLPKIPEYFFEDLDVFKNREIILKFDNEKNKRTSVINTLYENYKVTPDLESWLTQHIVKGALHYGIAFNYSETYPIRHLPHLDQSRDYNLTYVLNPGGDNVLTNFYQEQAQNLIRPRGIYVQNYDNLDLVNSVLIPANKWILLNTRIMHSVENLQSPRIAIQIGLDSAGISNLLA